MFRYFNSRLTIGARLLAVACAFMVPIVLLLGLYLAQVWKDVSFARKELAGVAYLEAIWPAYLGAATGAATTPDVNAASFDALFNTADASKAFADASGKARIEAGKDLISGVADGSNLTLDTDLDSFYAMDATTVQLPKLLSALVDLRTAMQDAAAGRAKVGDREVALNQARVFAASSQSSLASAMTNNHEGRTRAALTQRASQLAQIMSSLLDAASQPVTAKDASRLSSLVAESTSEIDATWHATTGELTRLLEARVSKFVQSLVISLSVVIVALLLSAGLLIVIHREAIRIERNSAAQQAQTEEERMLHEAEQSEQVRRQTLVVEALARALSELSDGNLAYRIADAFPPDYERLRADYNAAVEHLHDVMASVLADTNMMTSGIADISRGAQDLAQRTRQQAATLEETASALNQITTMVQSTASSASKTNEATREARTDAAESGDVVRRAVSAMNDIQTSANQIGQITGVIDEIAFQTNLLALNAGVEAARAGDAGLGFAVVAQEVRGLAQRSADSAKAIKQLISTSSHQVGEGSLLVSATGDGLNRIMRSVEDVTSLVATIAKSAGEEATALVQLNSAMTEMDEITQRNAAMVDETTAASVALLQQAEHLAKLMARFTIQDTRSAEGWPEPPRLRAAGGRR